VANSRDTRLVGNHRVLVTTDAGGFREYDLRTREVVREVIRRSSPAP